MRTLFVFFTLVSIIGCGSPAPSGSDGGLGPDTGVAGDSGIDAARPDAAGGGDSGTDGGRGDGGLDGAASDSPPDAPPACGLDGDLASAVGLDVVTGSTAGAATTFHASCAGDTPSPVRFYSWTAPADGTYAIDTLGSEYDTSIAVLDGACDAAELDCSDDAFVEGLLSRIDLAATSGRSYVIAVTGYDELESGAFHLSITQPGPTETECAGGADDDRDGLVDCADDDCTSSPACVEADCTDGLDDDSDGFVDCNDRDCDADAACAALERCSNGTDDDGDGAVDCDDSDCASHQDCTGTGPESCVGILCIPEDECIVCDGVAMCVPIGTTC